MTGKSDTKVNWFEQNGRSYAQFRPEYPAELAAYLATLPAKTSRALDVGCGTGQLTLQLAEHFDEVIGADPSGQQLENAPSHPRVNWLCAPAEDIPLADGGVDLVVAAQAAHWFDLPAFYAQARRLASPQAVIALISYGVLQLDDAVLNARFTQFYHDEIGPFWPPERKLVDDGYTGIDFPFEELAAPALAIERSWTFGEFLGYISTWSAVRRLEAAGEADILAGFAQEFRTMWGGDERRYRVTWPINMRIGRL